MNCENPNICLVAVSNQSHLPTALMMVDSFLEHNSEATVYLFLFDLMAAGVLESAVDKRITFFGINDLTDTKDKYLKASHRFNVFEGANLAKYVALDYVLNQTTTATSIIYADTDLKFYSNIQHFLEPLNKGAVALFTPHSLEFGDLKYDFDFLNQSGINAGMFALNSKASVVRHFIKWMIKALLNFGHFEMGLMFADQPNLGLAVTKLGSQAHTSSLKTVNVAYWNLHEREIKYDGSHYFVDDARLICFHFSGFRVENTERISIHASVRSNQVDATTLALLEDYRECKSKLKKLSHVFLPSDKIQFCELPFPLRLFRTIRSGTALSHPECRTIFIKWLALKLVAGVGLFIPNFFKKSM